MQNNSCIHYSLSKIIQQTNHAHNPHKSLYDFIGVEEGAAKLVNKFYDIVENNVEGYKLRILHLRGSGIAHLRVEQFNFLSGFLGEPNYMLKKMGIPALEASMNM